jgi:hypothetical protein
LSCVIFFFSLGVTSFPSLSSAQIYTASTTAAAASKLEVVLVSEFDLIYKPIDLMRVREALDH